MDREDENDERESETGVAHEFSDFGVGFEDGFSTRTVRFFRHDPEKVWGFLCGRRGRIFLVVLVSGAGRSRHPLTEGRTSKLFLVQTRQLGGNVPRGRRQVVFIRLAGS